VDPAIAIHQNRHVAVFGSSRTGRREDLFRMLEERAHNFLIARKSGI
jgi:hypothetical protein